MANTAARRKIIGAFVVGFALIAGAFVLSNFNTPNIPREMAAKDNLIKATDREYIAVTDKNDDGIEDWREEFVDANPIVVAPAAVGTSTFSPTTVTEQVGVNMMEALLINKTNNPNGLDTAALAKETQTKLQTVVQDRLYTREDIIVVPTSNEAVVTYGNTMGSSLIRHNVAGSEGELEILNRAVQTSNKDELKKIEPLAEMYEKLRDDALNTPVPENLVKEHLDLINVYNALYQNLDDMQLVFNDPIVTLMRIKRYEDDATGLVNGFSNLYRSLLPYSQYFSDDAPAGLFGAFVPS